MCNYIIVFIFMLHVALSLNPNAVNSLQVPSPPTGDNKVNYKIEVEDGEHTYESDLRDQSYSYRYKTADGSQKYESGHFEDGDLVAKGGYEYIGDNGLVYSVTYISDKDGFRPEVSFGAKTEVSSPPPTTARPPSYTVPSRPQCYPGSTDPRCPKNVGADIYGAFAGGGVKRKRSH